MSKNKQKSTEDGIASPEEQLGIYLEDNKEDHYNFEETVTWKTSTGSLNIDSVLGPITPGLLRLVGYNNEGKTPECLEVMRNFFIDVPNSRGVYVMAEGRLSEENKNRCGLKFVTNPEDWEDGTIFVFETNIYETVIGLIRSLTKNNPHKKRYAFCIDSLDGLILKSDLSKKADEAVKVAGPQVLTKKMFQNLGVGIYKQGTLMIMTSQVTAAPKIDTYAPAIHRDGSFSGGNAAAHWADNAIEFHQSYNSDFILDNPNGKPHDGKTKKLGKMCKVTIVKTTREACKRLPVQYPIKFGRKPSGIWLELEIVDMMQKWGDLIRAGAWYSLNPELLKDLKEINSECPEKLQGISSWHEFLEENPKIVEKLVSKYKNLYE